MKISIYSLGIVFLWGASSLAAEPIKATTLRCEYLTNPLGLDVKAPRLSWVVESDQRGQKQTAYHVLVASDVTILQKDKGDLWDSGKVDSDDTTAIVYAGKPLVSHQRCLWKVKVWDKDGKPSSWSQPALWWMGLLNPSDWKAQWIGCDKSRNLVLPEAPFPGAYWIWHAADKGVNKPKGHRLFLKTLTLPENVKITAADLLVTADDAFKFTVNGTLVVSNSPGDRAWANPKQADLIPHLKPGKNTLRVEVENATPSPAGLLARLTIKTAENQVITFVSDATWKTLESPGANWHNRAIDEEKLPAAGVVGPYGIQPWGKLTFAQEILPPPVYLRTTFQIAKPVRRATLYVTALGLVDVHLNGQRVSEDRFNPGWTDYTKRVYYRAYNARCFLRQGENSLGAILADGWYSGYVGFGRQRHHYGKLNRFLGQLNIEFEDGSRAVVASGPDWKASTGPIREADFLMGESFDARQIKAGWDAPGFDDATWDKVATGAELKPVVQHHPGPPVRVCGTFQPVKITEPVKGAYVLDLGQNFAGVPRLKIQGKPGQKITLRFAERLNPDGTIYTINLRSARCLDTYVCRGEGTEIWEPRFTFHGFQYVEITGLDQPPAKDTVTGLALSSDTTLAGSFCCSDQMLNRLHQNIYWTQRANFIDIPTDCPQRDERLGWTGDAQVYVRTATLNNDVQAFFTKWLVDLDDAQRADGQFPMVAPVKVAGPDGGPAWADAGVICPWTIYEVYGDKRQLAQHYPAMTRFIEFCRQRCTPDLLPPKQFHCFGDWLSIKANTPTDVIFTAYFAYSTHLTALAAEVLGKKEDSAKYQNLFDKIKAAFNYAYVAPDGRIKGDTQACYVLALAFDLVNGEKRRKAAQYLVEDIEKRGGHLSTGFIGTKDLMLVLAKIGRNDVAYRLLHNDTFPSWGFSIKHGATSIWERWDGWTPDKGFQDPGMNSFAHYSFGAVYQWMVENIGGIRAEGPSYKEIAIDPRPGGRLTEACTFYNSIRGRIGTCWKKQGDKLMVEVTIPANTTATVFLPGSSSEKITESGKPLGSAEGVRVLRTEAGQVVLAVGSGNYKFMVPGSVR